MWFFGTPLGCDERPEEPEEICEKVEEKQVISGVQEGQKMSNSDRGFSGKTSDKDGLIIFYS